MADVESYCSEKLDFMKDEISRIKELLDSEIFRSVKSKKDLSVIIGCAESLKKDRETSLDFRLAGNSIFRKKKHTRSEHLDIWNNYSQCIACAPPSSTELVQGYYNRSLFFFHIQKYEESIKDIDRASTLEKCNDILKLKLSCLKAECLIKLQDPAAEAWIDKTIILLLNLNLSKDIEADNLKKLNNAKTEFVKLLKIDESSSMDVEKPEIYFEISGKNEKIPSVSNALSIGYKENFGRCVVATRDIKPGELVVKEKFYSSYVNGHELTRHCSNCCKITYSSIPCDRCAYAMYCSEKCKIEAWNDYHKIECIIIEKIDMRNGIYLGAIFSLKTLVKILKQVESIKELKSYMEKIDNCSDPCKIGFSEGIYLSDNWTSILTLSMAASKKSELFLNQVSLFSTVCMYWIGMETDIFGKTINSASDFLDIEDAIYFAAFLSRLQHINTTNSHGILEEVDENNRRIWDFIEESDEHETVEIGGGLAAFSSLFNHSCNPDVIPFTNDSGEILFFALKPIKKDSQVFTCYGKDAMAYEKSSRINEISRYGFTCKCKACEENWPTFAEATELFPENVPAINFAPFDEFENCLNENLVRLEKLLVDKSPHYKEIYTAYGTAISIYGAIHNKWCKLPSCY